MVYHTSSLTGLKKNQPDLISKTEENEDGGDKTSSEPSLHLNVKNRRQVLKLMQILGLGAVAASLFPLLRVLNTGQSLGEVRVTWGHSILGEGGEYNPPTRRFTQVLDEEASNALMGEGEHVFTIELDDGNFYSVFVARESEPFPEHVFVMWRKIDGRVKILRRGPVRLRLIEERSEERILEDYGETRFRLSYGRRVALMEDVPGAGPLSSRVLVSNWTRTEWFCGSIMLAYVLASGDFYVDRGRAILSVRNKSSSWTNTSTVRCTFNTWVDGVGTPYAQVNADGRFYTWAPPCAACPVYPQGNAALHARAGVDVNLQYFNDGFGNRWLSLCTACN